MTSAHPGAPWRRRAKESDLSFGSLACLADTHGNTAALEAALASPEFALVDAVAFLGCTTTGPDPQGVLQLCALIDKPTLFISGNGERAVLQNADGDQAEDWPTGRWLARRHGLAGLAQIRDWPPTIACEVNGLGPVRLCHGSPRSDIELLTPHTGAQRIAEATASIFERTIVHGHTHLQYDRHVAGMRVIGAGSVGLPYTTALLEPAGRSSGPTFVLSTLPTTLTSPTSASSRPATPTSDTSRPCTTHPHPRR